MARSADATARSRPRRNPGRAGYLSGASGLSYPTRRVFTVIPFGPDGNDHEALFRFLDRLPEPARFAGIELQAPILFLPNVFEPAAGIPLGFTSSMEVRSWASCARWTARQLAATLQQFSDGTALSSHAWPAGLSFLAPAGLRTRLKRTSDLLGLDDVAAPYTSS